MQKNEKEQKLGYHEIQHVQLDFRNIKMEKQSEIKIGPEIPLEYIDKIQTNSSFINFECIRIVSDSPKK